MMTSKPQQHLVSLLFATTPYYKKNLERVLSLIESAKKHSLILAPEVCLSGFDYTHLEEVLAFASIATEALKEASKEKIIILTMLERVDGEVVNLAKIFYQGEVVFSRAKARLFRLGGEHKYMSQGSDTDFRVVEVAGIKIAIFICFELRFKELWQKAEGADVIVVPSWWGKPRAEHFRAFTQTLAIMNQCYVVASDSKNEECTGLSAIISPQGSVEYNGEKALLSSEFQRKEIEIIRRYLDVGRT